MTWIVVVRVVVQYYELIESERESKVPSREKVNKSSKMEEEEERKAYSRSGFL